MSWTLHHGDSLDVLRTLADASVDAVVTDPPYGLAFMGKRWDYDVPSVALWEQCLRVLKPGGHLLAFAGTRTQHRMAVRIEDAGFEIRDLIAWVYGSGFPKSRCATEAMAKYLAGVAVADQPERPAHPDVYKVTAFLKAARDRAGWTNRQIDQLFGTNGMAGHWTSTASQPAVPSVRQWQVLKERLGFGGEMDSTVAAIAATERPPDWGSGDRGGGRFLETLRTSEVGEQSQGWGTALKPALEPITVARKPLVGTVAANVQRFGTGAINVDGCRVGTESTVRIKEGGVNQFPHEDDGWEPKTVQVGSSAGRWPANLIHDGSDEVVGRFPGDDEVSASRFFYVPKASKADRDEGCEGLEERATREYRTGNVHNMHGGRVPDKVSRNHHPTVKPTDLMRYLCVLVTPPGGTVLDPFCGSGSTGVAAVPAGFRFVGIEREAEYLEIARRRLAAAVGTVGLFVEGGELVAAGSERGERGGPPSPATGEAK